MALFKPHYIFQILSEIVLFPSLNKPRPSFEVDMRLLTMDVLLVIGYPSSSIGESSFSPSMATTVESIPHFPTTSQLASSDGRADRGYR